MGNELLRSNSTSRVAPLPDQTVREDSLLHGYLLRLMRGESLGQLESQALAEALLDDRATDSQIAATLVALAVKGATVDELTGMAKAMRSRATRIHATHTHFIDTAGTGSSHAKTFNVSTAAAFVVAGAGLPVAKHGNRAATSRTGSADVLSALGVEVRVTPEISERCLNELGICFMFAPLYHGAAARVASVRRELGVHTAFNLLGPLTNPAGAPYQIVGVWHPSLVEPLARSLAALGTSRAWVVHGMDGLDEVTLADKTLVAEVGECRLRTFEISPEDFGLNRSGLEALRGDDPVESAYTIRQILEGRRRNQARDLVVINAAAALLVGGMTNDLIAARHQAEISIDSGAALEKLEALTGVTNE
jgi:anthranilate phosphoribosyltransferase